MPYIMPVPVRWTPRFISHCFKYWAGLGCAVHGLWWLYVIHGLLLWWSTSTSGLETEKKKSSGAHDLRVVCRWINLQYFFLWQALYVQQKLVSPGSRELLVFGGRLWLPYSRGELLSDFTETLLERYSPSPSQVRSIVMLQDAHGV